MEDRLKTKLQTHQRPRPSDKRGLQRTAHDVPSTPTYPGNAIPGNDSLAECLGQASRLWAWRVCLDAWEVYARLRRPLLLTPVPVASQDAVCRLLP